MYLTIEDIWTSEKISKNLSICPFFPKYRTDNKP